ncbi:MAG: NADH-quinone oxidoreductase subunit J [Candidatus Thermoplasmatota archaeon]|jgi:NADH-quinone oxidoreductase subunit J|nr:NADH-quinone oxidoreductase subunit J [Candidatus Thermoplasmatota archaeon]MCL5988630.1 NADH-quinone oxidoreductase subunit J [Candidatus Thermoplasmatota archaeon]
MIFEVIEIVFGAFLIVMSALSVAQKDVVRSIIFLLLFLSIMAANFIYLGATLIGAIELLVYVGAISALLVFTVMITGGKEFE